MTKLQIKSQKNQRGKKAMKAFLKLGLVLGLVLALAGCQGELPDDLVQEDTASGIIFVKATRTFTLNDKFEAGGNLFSLIPAAPGGKLTNLTNLEAGDVADPEISYDGLKVLFSMRRSRSDNWHIYEMNLDGTNLVQLTSGDHGNFDPTYLPNGNILFTSNRQGFRDEYERRPAEVMHVLDRGTGQVECISFNNSDDFDPFVKADGRVIYTRWDHHGQLNRFPLFFTNPDGHGTFTFFSPHARRGAERVYHPREMPDGSVVTIFSDRVLGDRGQVVIIKDASTAAEPFSEDQIEVLTPNVGTRKPFENGAFKYPHPLTDGRILVSYSPRFGTFRDENDEVIEELEADYGLYTMKRDGSNLALLYNDPDMHEFDAVVIKDRPIPPTLTSDLDHTQSTGVFTVENVYFRQNNDGHERPNKDIQEAKTVLVIEGLKTQTGDHMRFGHTNFERKRIIGEAPIEPDGSFSIEVPSNIAISFNVQDSLGRSIVTKRNWLTIRPGEQFEKCSGCHGPRGQESGNPNPIAATRAPTNLNVSAAQRRVINFSETIQPIVTAKCAPCHGGTNPAGSLSLTEAITSPEEREMYTEAYDNIMDSDLVRTGFSRRSRLIDIILGISDNPGTVPHPDTSGQYALSAQEIDDFIKWVDLGGQYR